MARQKFDGTTLPLVETDGAGGHLSYVRQDTTPTADLSPADAAKIALLAEILDVLRELRDECRATRLLVQERLNEGNSQQYDGLEMALAARDADEEA